MNRSIDLQALIDALPHLVWVCRADGEAEYFNANWHAYTGLDFPASAGEGWRAAIHPDDRAALVPAWQTALANDLDWEYHYRLRDRSGDYRWFNGRARRVVLEAGAEPRWVGTSTDVHEAHIALTVTRAQEQRFRALIDHLPMSFVVFDPGGRILEANHAICQSLDYSREELLSLDILAIDSAVDPDAARARWAAAQANETFVTPTRHRRRDGSEFESELRVKCYEHGGQRLFLATGQDLTAQRAAEAELRLHSALLELAPVIVFDLEGRIQFWSQHATNTYGHDAAHACGLLIGPLLRARLPARFPDLLDTLRASGRWQGEVEVFTAAGTALVMLSQWTLYRDPRDDRELVLNVYADISALKQADAQTRLAEAELHAALQRGGAGTFQWDIASNRVSWDRSSQMLLGAVGASSGDLPFEDALNVVHESDRATVQAAMRAAADDGIDPRFDAPTVGAAGMPTWVSVQARAVRGADGRVSKVTGVLTDISARVVAQQALAHSRETLRQYAGHLDHAIEEERLHIARELHDELGQRLSALKLDLHWLTQQFGQHIDSFPALRAHLVGMNDIIDATIKETRTLSASLRPLGLEQLGLGTALEAFITDFQRRTGVRCTTNLDAAARVPSEHTLGVFRIVQEAMTNVARHSHASEVEILLGAPDGDLRLEIHDNGVGLANASDKRTTLGLIGMRERAATMGATLEISTEGGTSIVLRFPAPACP